MKLLDILTSSIRASAAYNADFQAAPSCILWPDAERQWRDAMPILQAAMPELFILGDYEPQKRQGPAIWLRCVLGRSLADIDLPENLTPVIYLPGVGRRDLRAVDNCPKPLQPLAPLQYSGVFFSQANARDWTILAWLVSSDGGLGLDAAKDDASRKAMLAALPRLLREDSACLQGKKLDSDFFNSLLTGGDPVREILQWLNGDAEFRAARSENEWQAFVEICKSGFAFDPARDGLLCAAENLARHEGPWLKAWERYRESWRHFPNIEAQIRKCSPPNGTLDWYLSEKNSGWPQWNDEQEESLRKKLAALGSVASHECAARLLELEKIHAKRRDSLWAETGQAPLAHALRELAALAENSRASLAAGSIGDIVKIYAASGWRVDDAALKAMSECTETRDREIIRDILRNIYLPWLEDSSRYLQSLFENHQYAGASCESAWREGDCLLFVDGLRMDCAKNLATLLAGRGLRPKEEIYWAPLPSLTATGKPAVSPVCGQISGGDENADFEPVVTASGKALKGNFEKLLAEAGWEILKNGATGSGNGRAWAEYGELDQEGHHKTARFAVNLHGLIAEIAKYISALLAAGWSRVIVVTDHGWLWLPGGLPKIGLPADLVENKWGRCAVPKAGSIINARKYPWHWNKNRYFALADGAKCFRAGQEYAHGGLSLQECLLLRIIVGETAKNDNARLADVKWLGLRCKLLASGPFTGLRADIRLEPANADSSLAALPKAFKSDGTVSVIVGNDEDAGREAYIVLLDAENRIVAQEKTVIGGCRDGNG
ncbi:MAG: BREX-1 system phosphatase PglZ type B [Desulfovibrio sp.]|nr:BREX-1 system phosphatase PglZ type B [Desulfovibrio sp.]